MKLTFSASITREGEWYVAQCLELDLAAQGTTEAEAIANLRDVLALHHEEPVVTETPIVRTVEVEVGAA